MRACVIVGVIFAAALCPAQTELDLQKKSQNSLPPISFTETQRAVKPGDLPIKATTQFGSFITGKEMTGVFQTRTFTYTWPEPGLFRNAAVSIMSNKCVTKAKEMNSDTVTYFDGEVSYEHVFSSGMNDLLIGDTAQKGPNSKVSNAFSVPMAPGGHYEIIGNLTDPKFGKIIQMRGGIGDVDLAVDRDYMVVHSKLPGNELWVLDATQVGGHWIPTEFKEVRAYRSPVDVYTSITNIRPLTKADQVFRPEYKNGMLVIKGNVYYDVDKDGKLVKSKMQPESNRKLYIWAAMGFGFIAILSTIVIGIYKLFRRQPTQT